MTVLTIACLSLALEVTLHKYVLAVWSGLALALFEAPANVERARFVVQNHRGMREEERDEMGRNQARGCFPLWPLCCACTKTTMRLAIHSGRFRELFFIIQIPVGTVPICTRAYSSTDTVAQRLPNGICCAAPTGATVSPNHLPHRKTPPADKPAPPDR